MTDAETESVILHEIGECHAGAQLGPTGATCWPRIGSRAEIVARAVRDHVADCSVALPRLLERNNTASLHFYFANFTACAAPHSRAERSLPALGGQRSDCGTGKRSKTGRIAGPLQPGRCWKATGRRRTTA